MSATSPPQPRTALSEIEQPEDRASVLESILDNIPHGVCVYGPDRRVRLFNRAYVEIMRGAPLAIGDHLETVIRRRAEAGEYGPGVPEQVFAREMGHDIGRLQVRRRVRPNGTTIDVRTAPLPDGGHISVVTDVTPLMAAERELRRRAADLDAMLSSIGHGLTLFDAERRLVAANRQAGALLNLPPEMLAPGTSEHAIIARMHELGEFGAGAEADRMAAERHERDRSRPHAYRRRTRRGGVMEIRTDPVPGGGFVVTYIDVTEQEQAQEELRRAKAAAEAANQAKSRFLATMSHELRTPLNAVIGFSETLLRQAATASRDEIEEFGQAIHEAGRHLLGLINTILDVARIEAGRFEMAADRIDVARMLEAAARAATASFQAGEVALELDVAAPLPVLRADERRLSQVLGNLLSNAAKFTPAGGAVTISAALDGTGALVLRVADTGIGIPEADLERVFEPFTQLDGDLARRFQGAGLGLYVARSLVEAHEGSLRLASAPGTGTTAEIVLPAWRLERETVA